MLPKNNRLKKKKDFEKVFKKGKIFKENFLTIRNVENNLDDSRFGFVVSRKVSKRATVRNKIKRILRKTTEGSLRGIKKGQDVLIVVLPGLEINGFWEIKETYDKLLKKAGLTRHK